MRIFLSVFRLFVYTAHRMSHSWIPPFILFRFLHIFYSKRRTRTRERTRRTGKKRAIVCSPHKKWLVCVCVLFVAFNIGPEKLLWLLTFVGCLKMCAVKRCVPIPNSMYSIWHCVTCAHLTLHLPKRKQWDGKTHWKCHRLVWLVRACVHVSVCR